MWGFEVEIVEPYCVTMVREDRIVDLYVYPTMGGVVYLDAARLLGYRVYRVVGGVELPVLEEHVEAVVAVAHAVYKERIYTLNDYVTFKRWFDGRSLRLAEELGCVGAVEEALRIHHMVEKREVTLPYRIPLPRRLTLLGSKAMHDKLFREALPNLVKSVKDVRFGKMVVSKLTRETY